MSVRNRSEQLRRKLKEGFLFFDGGYGTQMADAGLLAGERPELWTLKNRDFIYRLHMDYLKAGANLIKTNTFGANAYRFRKELENDPLFLDCLIEKAVELAGKAIRDFETEEKTENHFIALDIGPSGRLLEPTGNLEFEDAVTLFAQIVKAGARAGADCILIETMIDSYETKAALLAAKENSTLPVFVTNTYEKNGTLLTGTSISGMIAMLEGLGADAVGMNCGLGAAQMTQLADIFVEYASVPVIVNPNAGLPEEIDGKTVYQTDIKEYVFCMEEMALKGVRILGGCCGTTPEYMDQMIQTVRRHSPVPLSEKNRSIITSALETVEFGKKPVLIGERINPTGKKKMQAALLENNMDYLTEQGMMQKDRFAQVLDVNTGLPEIDEKTVLSEAVKVLQDTVGLPLQIDTSDAQALEQAMRIYNGKPMVNSVNGKEESMRTVFPLVKKYGGLVTALTLDENGIPSSAEERAAIAERIFNEAEKYGISRKNIIVDPLAMAVSADPKAALETLSCIRLLKERFHSLVSLGVSNISFGLPGRDVLNAVFFASALECGLDAAIMNPNSERMLQTYFGFCALHHMDEQFLKYIEVSERWKTDAPRASVKTVTAEKKVSEDGEITLRLAIEKGMIRQASETVSVLLRDYKPMDIVNGEIIPALDNAGKEFENQKIFLPQLIMCSKAAQKAFEIIRKAVAASGFSEKKKGSVVLATVKGDVHDIGKNIVKVLLENYGYEVIDLGIDVDPQKVTETVLNHKVRLAGLSALMTTTVPNMEKTIQMLRKKAPFCKVVVGGAVLNQNYADRMGADCYAPAAMDTVRFAEKIFCGE